MADDINGADTGSRRSLAAIMFTDIVGFSARMSRNETATLDACHRDLADMRRLCEEERGQVLKNTGDGLLIHFPSAVDAVRCALVIQRRFAERAAAASAGVEMEHRIGIHVGDVFFNNRDVMGDGVNIAARLHEQAEPGGIVISNTVYDLVKGRVELKATYLGPRDLKNIKDQVPIYKLLITAAEEAAAALGLDTHPASTATSSGRTAADGAKGTSKPSKLVAIIALVAVAGLAAAYVTPLFMNPAPQPAQPPIGAAPSPSPSPATPPTPEQIATTRQAFADKYDYRGMLQWMKQHQITDQDLLDRYTTLASLRDRFDKALADTTPEKPLDAHLKSRNMRPMQVWREPGGRIGVRRAKIEAVHAIENLPKLEMFTILFTLGKPGDNELPADKDYCEALVTFADEHQLSSPVINRLRNVEPE